MAIAGIICSFIVVLVGGSLWRGYVLSLLWAWFIAATFHVPPISIPAAIGLALFASMFVHTPTGDSKPKAESASETLATAAGKAFFEPLIVLGFAAIVRMWMPGG